MEWTSSFIKQGQDQTKLGFNLSFVPAATTNASTAGSGGVGGGGFMEVIDPRVQHNPVTSGSSIGGKRFQ